MNKILTSLALLISISLAGYLWYNNTTSNTLDENQVNVSPSGKITKDKPDPLLTALKTIDPPFENLDVPYSQHEVDVVQGKLIRMDNGTMIRVPKDAFVDQDGNPITGKVTLKYREFHKASEIIASGIPMTNRNDDSKYMETAGMFEMLGEQKGNPIYMAKDKEVEVDMASFVKGNNFDFFYLDEEDCQWENKGTKPAKPNKEKIEKKKRLPKLPLQPVKPRKAYSDKFVFNLDVNYTAFPELKAYRNVIWEYNGNTPASDPEKNKWVFEHNWVSIDIKPFDVENGKYELQLRGGDKQFNSIVKPVLKGKDLEKAMAVYRDLAAKYNKIKEDLKLETNRLAQEADLLRSFRINKFGVHNWDVWKSPKRIICNADFQIDGIDTDVNKVKVFLISGEQRAVVRYSANDFNKFSFDPTTKNNVVAVLPGNKVAVFSHKQFRKMDSEDLRMRRELGETVIFKMDVIDQKIESVQDLQKVIETFS